VPAEIEIVTQEVRNLTLPRQTSDFEDQSCSY
jgi:hypothetical protein